MFRLVTCGSLFLAVPALTAAQQLAPLPPALPRTHTPKPTVAKITPGDLMTRLYIFADDSMRGRGVRGLGNTLGTTYIASELKRMGVQPGGEHGTYFQELPRYRPVVQDEDAWLKVNGKALTFKTEFVPVGAQRLERKTLKVVYGGPLTAPAITADKAGGQFVVFSLPAGTKLDSTFTIPTAAAGAAAIGVVALDDMSDPERSSTAYGNFHFQVVPATPIVLLSASAAQAMFGQSLASVTAGTRGQNISANFAFVPVARNVIGIIPGSDPVLRNEYVAIGAHNDHIGRATASRGDHDSLRVFLHYAAPRGAENGGTGASVTPEQMSQINAELAKLRKLNPPRQDSIYNGADDDGSGSVTVLEIAEHIAAMKVKPKRSILFVWHTGEESGMLGSGYFTSHPTVPIDSIVTQLNVDMVGRGEASDLIIGSPDYLFLIGARKLSTELGHIVDSVNVQGKHDFKMDENDNASYYTRSDHYMYAQHGIPVAFFSTNAHPDYHQVTDEPQYIHYDKMARIGQLIDDVAVHVANLDHRPVVDQKP